MADPDELVDVELTGDELELLLAGLREWGGPAYCTDALAVAMGFVSVADLAGQVERIGAELHGRTSLSRWDWTRALLATEVVFASDVVGSGVEWHSTTGFDDEHSIRILRGLQRKLVSVTVAIGPRGAWRVS